MFSSRQKHNIEEEGLVKDFHHWKCCLQIQFRLHHHHLRQECGRQLEEGVQAAFRWQEDWEWWGKGRAGLLHIWIGAVQTEQEVRLGIPSMIVDNTWWWCVNEKCMTNVETLNKNWKSGSSILSLNKPFYPGDDQVSFQHHKIPDHYCFLFSCFPLFFTLLKLYPPQLSESLVYLVQVIRGLGCMVISQYR